MTFATVFTIQSMFLEKQEFTDVILQGLCDSMGSAALKKLGAGHFSGAAENCWPKSSELA
jgi:hypothetical protein